MSAVNEPEPPGLNRLQRPETPRLRHNNLTKPQWMKLVDTVTHLGLDSIDQELQELHRYMRDEPMTNENRRALQARSDVLLERRHRLTQRQSTTMIKGAST